MGRGDLYSQMILVKFICFVSHNVCRWQPFNVIWIYVIVPRTSRSALINANLRLFGRMLILLWSCFVCRLATVFPTTFSLGQGIFSHFYTWLALRFYEFPSSFQIPLDNTLLHCALWNFHSKNCGWVLIDWLTAWRRDFTWERIPNRLTRSKRAVSEAAWEEWRTTNNKPCFWYVLLCHSVHASAPETCIYN